MKNTGAKKTSARPWQRFALLIALAALGSIIAPSRRALAQTPSEPSSSPAAPVEADPASSPPQVTVRCRRRLVGNQCLRLRATFFEDERPLRQFRNVDFLEAALDGAGNTINSGIRDPNLILSTSEPIIDSFPEDPDVTARVPNRDTDSDDFLNGSTLIRATTGTDLRIVNVNPNDNPQTGVLTLRGSIGGRQINSGDYTNAPYRGSASSNGDLQGGVIVVTNRNNPREQIQIVIPPTNIEGPEDEPFIAPGRVSIGRGVDR